MQVKLIAGITSVALALSIGTVQAKVFPDPAGDAKIRAIDIRKVDASVAGGIGQHHDHPG